MPGFKPRGKQGPGGPGKKKKKEKKGKLPSIKNQIRGVQRLLAKVGALVALELGCNGMLFGVIMAWLGMRQAGRLPTGPSWFHTGWLGPEGPPEAGGAPGGAAAGQRAARAGGAGAQVCQALSQGGGCRWGAAGCSPSHGSRVEPSTTAPGQPLCGLPYAGRNKQRAAPPLHSPQVRFFERVKIERALGKLQKQQRQQPLSPGDQAQVEQLKQDLQVRLHAATHLTNRGFALGICTTASGRGHEAGRLLLRPQQRPPPACLLRSLSPLPTPPLPLLQYVLHFPKGEKYVSLLKDADDPADQARLESERARLRCGMGRGVPGGVGRVGTLSPSPGLPLNLPTHQCRLCVACTLNIG